MKFICRGCRHEMLEPEDYTNHAADCPNIAELKRRILEPFSLPERERIQRQMNTLANMAHDAYSFQMEDRSMPRCATCKHRGDGRDKGFEFICTNQNLRAWHRQTDGKMAVLSVDPTFGCVQHQEKA